LSLIFYRRYILLYPIKIYTKYFTLPGNDIGTQYRSAIYYFEDKQQELIDSVISELKKEGIEVVTEVERAKNFYKAEEYHQDYLDKNPGGYCHINLNKIEDF
jgi:Peptide methionine sulfoxide reductase